MQELFRRLRVRPGLTFQILICSLLINLFALAGPIFVILVLSRYVSSGLDGTLVTLTLGVLIVIFLEVIFRKMRIRIAAVVSPEQDVHTAESAFYVLTHARMQNLEQLPLSLRQEIIRGLDSIQNAYGPNNLTACMDVPFALLFIGAIWLLSPILATIAGVCTLLSISLTLMGTRRGQAFVNLLLTATSARSALVTSALNSADAVRAYNGRDFIQKDWTGQTRKVQAIHRKMLGSSALVESLSKGIIGLMTVGIYATGAKLVVTGSLTVGALIGANILASRALGPFMRLPRIAEQLAKARQAIVRLNEFSRLPMESRDGTVLKTYTGRLEFKDLAFAHPGGSSPLFESLDLRLEPGQALAVYGPNGSGKTTLARLVVGLLTPSRGQIFADGIDLRQVRLKWWRKQIIYLPQEPTFLIGTIRDNILLADPEIDEKRLNKIIGLSGLREFLDKSPKGLLTPIRDNAGDLSLGIRRRLALAMALASDGRAVIMDEPTEALDFDGKARIYALLNALRKQGRTIVVFSHDRNILKGADYIIDLGVKPIPKIAVRPVQPCIVTSPDPETHQKIVAEKTKKQKQESRSDNVTTLKTPDFKESHKESAAQRES
ncbi:MAG: ATP-binding cassette domain-containing protein [Desulfobacterales bacterium]|uniref:ATP-binding cassette domain-containing protein n=1 Tax=Candidatus Desulfatibia vada TaxID=2841696 RepID=A0A8J6P7T2_9BACT|nr:ATP-binding cassette domain-containing protein [Candidatus Desulfatibia vada]